MFGSYQWWDLALEDLTLHCPSDLVKGVVPVYDGRHWRLVDLWDISEDLPEILEELEEIKEEYDVMIDALNRAIEAAEAAAADNPEIVRFLLVQMDGDTETTVNNSWIDAETDATPTWLSGTPNGIVEFYVWDGYIKVVSSENETWVVRLRLSKAKPQAFLNSL